MDQEIIIDAIKHNTAQQSRIADAMEEILRLVKADQRRWRKGSRMKIKNNDLTHYFLRPHNQLPQGYLDHCNKFFKELSLKQEATSHKPQASSLTSKSKPDIG